MSSSQPIIARGWPEEDRTDIVAMLRAYAQLVADGICFADYDQELAGLPGKYAPPQGAFFVARRHPGAPPIGCIALRQIDPETATVEIKRLYVDPAARGMSLGRRLTEAAIDEARRLGYRRIVLDTLPKLGTAIALYRDMGFVEIERYNDNPGKHVLFFAREIA